MNRALVPDARGVAAVLGFAVLAGAFAWVHAMLATNPGFFSHDELQWGAFADVAHWRAMPWNVPWDIGQFQYRPLTFNLWLVLSHLLFESPRAMHALWVSLGFANAALLAAALFRLDARLPVAVAAALVFVLSPYAVYVHGWVATLADLLWVGLGLLLVLCALRHDPAPRRPLLLAVQAGALTALALLAKEAAVSIPALLLVAWGFTRERRWAWAFAGAAAIAAVYLAVRVDVLLLRTPEAAAYGWSPLRIPQRFAQYHLFTYYPWRFEIDGLFEAHGRRLVAVAVICAGAYVAALRRGPLLGWLALASSAALGPVLILDSASNQYGYGFAAVLAGVLALAWRQASRAGRVALVLLASLSTWHGVRIAQEMARVGDIQSRFSPGLASLAAARPDTRLLLDPACAGDRWVYTRLSHAIPSYQGVKIGTRVQLAEPSNPEAFVVACDGTVSLGAPTTP